MGVVKLKVHGETSFSLGQGQTATLCPARTSAEASAVCKLKPFSEFLRCFDSRRFGVQLRRLLRLEILETLLTNPATVTQTP